MRLVFMGTPAFAVPTLKALVSGGHDIVAVYTQPPRPAGRGQKDTPSPVHATALELGLDVHTPESLKPAEIQAQFAAHKADAAVVVAYGLLLPKPILDAYPMGCINVHPSLLPRWRGAAPIQRTIMAGDTHTAICIMQMDEGLDTGGVIVSEPFPVPPGTTSGALHDNLSEHAGPLVLKALTLLQNGAKPEKQSDTGVTYAKKITKEEAHIDWNRPAEEVLNKILGLNPTPGASFMYNGETIKIFEATISGGNHTPGTIVDDRLGIACGSGVLHPIVLQRPGKKRMALAELLNGFSIPVGTKLG